MHLGTLRAPVAQNIPPQRRFQTVLGLEDNQFPHVLLHLDRARADALLAHPEPDELLDHLQLSPNVLAHDAQAWLDAVEQLDRAARSQTLTPIGSLALAMRLVRMAADNFPAQISTPAFVSFVTNLQPLDELVLGANQQEAVTRFARIAVQIAFDILPATASVFFGFDKNRRVQMFTNFVRGLVDTASDLGLGIHDDDREQFVVHATGDSRYAGRFDVLKGRSGRPAVARLSVGGPLGLEAIAEQTSQEANDHFSLMIEAAVHEVIHACQNSSVDCSGFAKERGFSSDAAYHEAMAAFLGCGVNVLVSRKEAIDITGPLRRSLWLPLDEKPAWFASWITREFMTQCAFFDEDLRSDARMNAPSEREAIARLIGIRPRGGVTVCENEADLQRLDAGSPPLEAGHFRVLTERFEPLAPHEDAALDRRGEELTRAL